MAKITAKSDAIEEVKAELLKMIAPTRQEKGALGTGLDNLTSCAILSARQGNLAYTQQAPSTT